MRCRSGLAALLLVAARAWAPPRRVQASTPHRAPRRASATRRSAKSDPFRPAVGSSAPAVVNALVRLENGQAPLDGDAGGDVAARVDRAAYAAALADAVAEAAWVAKYQEEGRFGLPLDSDDPLVAMQRCECLLALYLLEHHPDGLAADDGAPPLRADDFIDEERLGVLRGR